MSMIKAIVVDDEWYNLAEICELVENTGFMSVEGRYQNPGQALDEVDSISPQVAFIDIEMPELDGMTLAEKLLEKKPSIIIVFITSWHQYAVQAFDLNALDYIMKPIKPERFNRMVEKICHEIQLQSQRQPNVLKIKCFGSLETSIDRVPIKWERAKAEELFAYLLLHHGSYVHKEIIIEDLWPDYEIAKALPILQTSICKIRNIFSKMKQQVMLNYSGNKYCLTITNAECDYFLVEQALANFRVGEKATYAAVEQACLLLGKGLLTQMGCLWSMAKEENLRKRLALVMQEIVSDYSLGGNAVKLSSAWNLLADLVLDEEEGN